MDADILADMREGLPRQEEYVNCGLCGSDNPRVLFGEHGLPDGRRGGIARCLTCGLVYRNVRPQDCLDGERHQYVDTRNISSDWTAARKRVFRRHIEVLDAFRKNNRILDVGAGHGWFLNLCSQRGWECHGVDIVEQAVEFAKREFGLSIKRCSLPDAHFPDEHFDAVTFWNVLDQLPDPAATLRETRRVLRQGGVVMIRCPNAAFHVPVEKLGSLYERMGGSRALTGASICHLYLFDRTSLKRLLENTGFSNVEVSNASLSWTTTQDARARLWRNVACGIVFVLVQALNRLTLRKLVMSPSIVATAVKVG